ncbi:MAG: chemotaxis protein CheA [Promethearchaeota archaeon]|nr:MAG: chemotaxis protein CheA [Candidatus Lokiarchaeota archaeon]
MSSKEDKDFKLFVKEAEELIRKIEESILNLEENFKNNDPVEQLYFSYHNLKGMTGMVGFDNFSKLCHSLENLLDEIKDYEKRAENKGQLIGLLFESHDVMRNLIKKIKESDKEDLNRQILKEFEKRINNLKTSTTTSDYDITFFKPLSKEEFEKITSKSNYKFFKVYIEIQDTCVFKKVRLFIIFRALDEIGRICSSSPEPTVLEKGAIDNDFEIYFMTKESKNVISHRIDEILEIESRKITEISSDEFYNLISEYCEKMLDQMEGNSLPTEEYSIDSTQESTVSSVIADNFDDQNKITSIKVDIQTLETLMDYFGELVILKNQMSQILQKNREREGSRLFDDMDKLFLEIQEIIFQLKLVRVEKTFRRYRRLVRDVAKETGKQIKFVLKGLDVEIDRKVLEELNSPLIHLLRNAIYHGIESPEERNKKNKDIVGTLRLESYRKAGSIYIKVKDDGRGLNYEGIRRKAIRNGMYSPEEAGKLTNEQLEKIIFRSGFSTLRGADQISGRGMGLAIVSEKVEELGGSVEVNSVEEKGTEFILDVPFTRAILKAQIFSVGGDLYAIPIENIKQIYFYKRENLDYIKGVEHYRLDSELVPLIRVDEYLGLSSATNSNEFSLEKSNSSTKIAIWCKKDEENSAVLVVDEILQQMEVVIKPFKSKYSKFRSVLGVTITGRGKICMVMDVMDLISSISREVTKSISISN